MQDKNRNKAKEVDDIKIAARRQYTHDYLAEVNHGTGDDDALHPRGERGKAERHCASAVHKKRAAITGCLLVSLLRFQSHLNNKHTAVARMCPAGHHRKWATLNQPLDWSCGTG